MSHSLSHAVVVFEVSLSHWLSHDVVVFEVSLSHWLSHAVVVFEVSLSHWLSKGSHDVLALEKQSNSAALSLVGLCQWTT